MRSSVYLSVSLLSLLLLAPALAALRPLDFAELERLVSGVVALPVGKDGGLSSLAQEINAVTNGALAEGLIGCLDLTPWEFERSNLPVIDEVLAAATMSFKQQGAH